MSGPRGGSVAGDAPRRRSRTQALGVARVALGAVMFARADAISSVLAASGRTPLVDPAVRILAVREAVQGVALAARPRPEVVTGAAVVGIAHLASMVAVSFASRPYRAAALAGLLQACADVIGDAVAARGTVPRGNR